VDTFIAEYTATIQERNDRLRNFNRMASHELRTPLGTLLFAAAALDQPAVRNDNERLGRVAEAIRGNTQRLARLVENLQRIARLGESPDAPNTQRIDLSVLAGEVAKQLEDMAAARGVSLVIDERLPEICVDPARLELVLLNLVSNAIKYCDPDKPQPFVGIAAVQGTEPGTIVLNVRDNGLGVPEELQHTIFERFSRAHAHLDETLGVSGTGLGLAIVAECVEAIGGTIRCESMVGEGTTFVLTVPVEPRQAPAVPVAF
jgi:signal transduction histidine kinase